MMMKYQKTDQAESKFPQHTRTVKAIIQFASFDSVFNEVRITCFVAFIPDTFALFNLQ